MLDIVYGYMFAYLWNIYHLFSASNFKNYTCVDLILTSYHYAWCSKLVAAYENILIFVLKISNLPRIVLCYIHVMICIVIIVHVSCDFSTLHWCAVFSSVDKIHSIAIWKWRNLPYLYFHHMLTNFQISFTVVLAVIFLTKQ